MAGRSGPQPGPPGQEDGRGHLSRVRRGTEMTREDRTGVRRTRGRTGGRGAWIAPCVPVGADGGPLWGDRRPKGPGGGERPVVDGPQKGLKARIERPGGPSRLPGPVVLAAGHSGLPPLLPAHHGPLTGDRTSRAPGRPDYLASHNGPPSFLTSFHGPLHESGPKQPPNRPAQRVSRIVDCASCHTVALT